MRTSIVTTAAALGLMLSSACGGSSGGEDDFPELTPFPASMEERLHEIRDKVAEIRGLPINEDAVEGLITAEDLEAYGLEQFAALEDSEEEIEAAEAVWKLLGLIPADYTLEDFISDSSGAVAGIYYFEADRLVLVGEATDELSMSDELTLAHEYAHSLQDREVGLDTFIEDWSESKAAEEGYSSYEETLRCLIEGDAELVQRLYAEEVFGPDWREQLQAESADDDPVDIVLPEFWLRALAFNYVECPRFVEALYEEGGWDAVNAAYDDPPATTEQVLHPDKYLAGELASGPKTDSLADELEGWSQLSEGQFGEYDIFNYFYTRTGDPLSAVLAADGWGSGWTITYGDDSDASRVVVDITLRFDTRADWIEFTFTFPAVLESYGVKPEESSEDLVFRWTALEEYGQHGALIQEEDRAKVRIIFATDEEALEMFLPAD
ncbi:MAG TPA: hypothetical protein VIW01_14085 [Dehalococcoidia bacterium]